MIKEATLRFYEELGDHLPADKKQCDFVCRFAGRLTAAALLSALGVPLAEVDLILVNGESADSGRTIEDGDRISCYPVFEAFDIAGTARVRESPLRQPRFLAGPGLERLAACLRMIGFDTLSGADLGPEERARAAVEEKRILLALDERRASAGARICRVAPGRPGQQCAEVLARLDLYRMIQPLGRCPRCNAQQGKDEGSECCRSCGRRFPGGFSRGRALRFIERLAAAGWSD